MKNYIKNYIIDRLNDLQGRKIYLCDFASYLYESDNANGSITCNRNESREFINKHLNEYKNVIEYWKMNAGAEFSNEVASAFFDNSEKAHCFLVFCYVDSVFSWVFNGESWDNQQEITAEFIAEITEKLDKAIDEAIADLDDYGNN